MRIRTAGVGLALALSASPLLAQAPPAATLGQLRPIEDPNITTVRGQFPDPRTVPAPAALRPIVRTQAAPPATPPVGQPKLVPNPMVTELRDLNGQLILPGQSVPLATTFAPPPLTSNPACPPVESLGMEAPTYGGGYSNALFPGRGRLRSALMAPADDRFTLGAEYLLWFTKAQTVPTLFTTSSPQFNGTLGQGDTRALFGDDNLGNNRHTGGRFSAQYLFPNRNWGLAGNAFFLGTTSKSYDLSSNTDSLIARPFTNINTGQQFSQLTAFPGLSTGGARIETETSIWGGEINAKRALLCGPNPCSRLDLLIGFKNLNVSESLNITETFARTPNSPLSIGVPNAFAGTVVDRFRTENHFYGVNVGMQGEIQRGRWYAQGKASVAFGRVYQTVIIDGSQTIITDTGIARADGGLLALPGANIGTYTQSKFGVVPEAGLTLGINLTPHLRLGVGYNILYVNSVVRPAGQIDTGLDVTRIPNFPLDPSPARSSIVRPTALPLRDTDFFVQGLTFQLQWTW